MGKRKAGAGECVIREECRPGWESDVQLAERDAPAALTAVLPLREGPWPGERFDVPADLAYGTAVRRQIQSVATDHCMSPADTADLVLAVSEAFNNAVRHGTSGPDDLIQFSVQIDRGKAAIELRYLGEAFEAGVPELPPPTSSSGRGRYIMAMLLDRVEYRFDPPWTTVRLVKSYRIQPAPQTGGGCA
jgi:anti-sigma regulatory factor (Ser/Thr protein kinase)